MVLAAQALAVVRRFCRKFHRVRKRTVGSGGGDGRRWFVVGKDLKNNVLLVEQGEDSPLLYSSETIIDDLTWIAGEAPLDVGGEMRCQVRLRHRQPLQDAPACLTDTGHMTLRFDAPQRAVTPGQSAVLYLGEACLGGGVIQ